MWMMSGCEGLHGLLNSGQMAQAKSVEVHAGVKRNAGGAALQFHSRNGTVVPFSCLRADMYAEERQVMTAREGIELAAGQRDAVHLVEAICQECNARRVPGQYVPKIEVDSYQRRVDQMKNRKTVRAQDAFQQRLQTVILERTARISRMLTAARRSYPCLPPSSTS